MPGVNKAPARRTRLPAEQRRESILDAATEVFAEAGYRAGKVSDVAARVGVTEPVIFQNFGSKAALYGAVLDRVAGQVRAELGAAAGQHGSATELLAHVLTPNRGTEPHSGGSHRGALFADAAALAADPATGGPARQVANTLAGHLADLLRQGQSDGTIRTDADPRAAAWMLLSILASRPFRNAAMPDHDRGEHSVAALALQALMPSAELGRSAVKSPRLRTAFWTRLVAAALALGRGELPVDSLLLSERCLVPAFGSRAGAFAALPFALLRSSFAFVREPLPLVCGALPLVRQPLALIGQHFALIREVLTPAATFSILTAELPVDPGQVPSFGLPITIGARLNALAALQLQLFRRSLPLVCESLTLIGCQFPHVREPLALVRDPLALIGQVLAPADCGLAPSDALTSPVARLAQLLASQGKALSFRGKLFSLLGNVLALGRYSLAFSRYPDELVRLVRMHLDLTSCG